MFREFLQLFEPDVTQGDFPENVIMNPGVEIADMRLPEDRRTLLKIKAQVEEYIRGLSPTDSAFKLDRANAILERVRTDIRKFK